jgi:hypothetical protein
MANADLYEDDFTAWAEAQAEALRKRSLNEVDWANVAEEIEDLGRSNTRTFQSLVELILQHLLKIEYSGLAEPYAHWADEIDAARHNLSKEATPTLLARAPGDLAARYAYAIRALRLSYRRRNERAPDVPDACPYSWEDVLGRGEDWIPGPAAPPK